MSKRKTRVKRSVKRKVKSTKRKNPGGRPKKPKSKRSDEWVRMRVTSAEKRTLYKAVPKRQFSAWALRILLPIAEETQKTIDGTRRARQSDNGQDYV